MANLPDCIRATILCDLLPEVLHDLNNECSAVEGLSLLLQSEARDATKIGERARRLRDCAANLERAAWISHVANAMLGSPLSLQNREEGFSWFIETTASSIERHGGVLEVTAGNLLEARLDGAQPVRSPLQIGWFFAIVRAFAGRKPGRIEIMCAGPGGVGVSADSGEADPGIDEAFAGAHDVGMHFEKTESTPRRPRSYILYGLRT